MATENEIWIESGEFFEGLEIYPLDEDLTPVEAFSVFQFEDEDSEIRWGYRTTPLPNREELLGALVVQATYLEEKLVANWDGSDE